MLRNWLRNKLNDPAHFYLLIGLVFSLVFAGLFAAIAEDVVTHADLAVLDTRIESQLLAQMTPASANVLNDISYLGDATFIALVSLGLLGWWA